ncbi:MAG: thiamine pyrophosphate-dependent enzyme, partial [Vulcanococcus sp.]
PRPAPRRPLTARWAIGMNHPRATATTLGDEDPFIYKKGPAFGMPGVHVDGMDVLKVRFLGRGLFLAVLDGGLGRFSEVAEAAVGVGFCACCCCWV